MKIIKFEKKTPLQEYQTDKLYDFIDKILFFGSEYLPFIFLKTVYLDEKKNSTTKMDNRKTYESNR